MSTKALSLCRHANMDSGHYVGRVCGRLNTRHNPRRDRGVVLILAVFAVTLLTVLVVGITAAVRVELLASRSGLNRVKALYEAQAGINQARALLIYDERAVDTLVDEWGPDAKDSLDYYPQELGDGFYRARVLDGCGRIDINEADITTLARLTGDDAVAAAIVDWRDPDDEPVSADGAEADYYQSLPYPYRPRNGPFETPGELLLVRGVTPEMYFGTKDHRGLADLVTVESQSLNTDASGQPRMPLNEFRNWSEQGFRDVVMAKLGGVLTLYEANEIFRGLSELGSAGYTSLSQLATAAGLEPGRIALIIDSVCIETDPIARNKVNLNTAPLEVIAALPGSSEGLASAIEARRRDQPFQALGDVVAFLMEQPGGVALFEQMIDRVTTKSSTFFVKAMGWTNTGKGFRTLTALMRRTDDDVLVIRQSEEDWPLSPPEERQTQIARR